MVTEILDTSYENNNRISNQKLTYTKSEDLRTLASLYAQLSNIEYEIENGNSDPNFIKEMTHIKEDIIIYENYISGYGDKV